MKPVDNKKKSDEIVRVGLRMPEYLKEFYIKESDKYNIGYTNYIVMLLIQYYEQTEQQNKYIDSLDFLKRSVESDDTEEIKTAFKKLADAMDSFD